MSAKSKLTDWSDMDEVDDFDDYTVAIRFSCPRSAGTRWPQSPSNIPAFTSPVTR